MSQEHAVGPSRNYMAGRNDTYSQAVPSAIRNSDTWFIDIGNSNY